MSSIQTIDNELPSTARPKINSNFSNLNTDKLEKAGGAASGNIATFGSGNVLQDSGKTVPAGSIVGTTDAQTLTNKTVDGATPTEIGYLSGVTSGIQSQLNGKAATSHAHSAADITSGTVAQARLGSGSSGAGTKFLADDQTYKSITTYQELVASDNLKASADTNQSFSTTTPTKKKEIQVKQGGVLRVKFDLNSNGGSNSLAQIYVNGVAVGTLRSQSSGTPSTYSEDITILPFSTVQLYCHQLSGGITGNVQNFRLYWVKQDISSDSSVTLN